MFNNISWQGYWVSIALLTAGYYLVIYLRYFRKDFSTEWNKKSTSKEESFFSSLSADGGASPAANTEQATLFGNADEFQHPAKDTIESAVYTCMDEVAAYLEEAKQNKCVKEDLLYALRSILRKYPAIAASEYKESATTVLVDQCEYYCSVHLSADDVLRVWVEG